ncbi:MaoC/PaaZ C-terminal domain-containing protein [Paraburkholderia phymatum]|uniref:MaoC/PaaZ C-terminal domain-containing protein n=1 Tax=Paraburkholderia phymatum TaxID=148447 RepID=UPI003180C8B4
MSAVFDPAKIVASPPRETIATHDARDVILYALGVGVGTESATSDATLRHVYETQLQVLPTMAVVLAWPGFWLKEPQYGVTWQKVLHAAQSLEVFAPLPPQGELRSVLSVERIVDKGADKGSLLYSRRDLYALEGGALLATERRTTFLRGDGGHGSAGANGDGLAPEQNVAPERAPDTSVPLATRDDQALLYRLSGDRNPLHIDPRIAEAAGFGRPILHGLCTYGVVARALTGALCNDDASRFARMACRFSKPVYPGEIIVTDIWITGEREASFVARVAERDAVVLGNGRFQWR